MLRMEIALVLVLGVVAYMYDSAERTRTALHRTFSALLAATLVHLVFDALTLYTVNHLDSVPKWLNDGLHRLFVGTMVLVVYLFYQYIAILVEEESGKPRKLDLAARVYLAIAEASVLVLPVHYAVTPLGNYSDGIHANVCYVSVGVYLLLCAGLLFGNWKNLNRKKRFAIGAALVIELSVSVLQGLHPTWLISSMGITLMTLAFYLTLENPDILRSELTEQKMSMLYLKSQVNPHFLYNTLDTIRIQAQLNGDEQVASLLMRLASFFRRSVKVDRPQVRLEDELELIDAYLDLMCMRYPALDCAIDVAPELLNAQVPNFILQPLVENSLLHGLKGKGYRGTLRVSAEKQGEILEILMADSGTGFAAEKKQEMDEMLLHYDTWEPKLTGNSIGVLNVQKRIKLLCGKGYGLRYEENGLGGVTARLSLPWREEEA